MLSQELLLGDLKRALMGPKLPKSRKSRAKTMIITDILSRFFFLETLGLVPMTKWSYPQFCLARKCFWSTSKGSKGAQKDQKDGKLVPKLWLIQKPCQDFSFYSHYRYCQWWNEATPQFCLARNCFWGSSKGPKRDQNDQKVVRPVLKVSSFEIFFQDFLSTGSRDKRWWKKVTPCFSQPGTASGGGLERA